MMHRSHFKTKGSFLLIAFLFVTSLSAQKLITGVIMDGSINETLIGGNVMIKGKTVGAITDLNGKYKVVALPTDVLVYSYIGMEKQEILVGDKSVINLTLKPSSHQLSEVVAIGYGTVKKSDLTGSVSVISTKELTRNPAPSAAQALQGKAPGVLVTQSGTPGGGATIRVRGVGSINKNADPIFILDGVQVSDISGIQPQDIESMQVLKDASASAIYGANGSNGVIIITTKRGKSGKPQVNLSSFYGVTLSPKEYDVMNADQYSSFYSALRGAKPEYEQPFREKYYGSRWQQGTNWQKEIFKNGQSQNHNLTISGGGEGSNFSISFGYTNEVGTILKSTAERFQLRANSDFKLSKFLKVGENISANYAFNEAPQTNGINLWDLSVSPLMKVYNANNLGGFETYQSPYSYDTGGNLIAGGSMFSNTLKSDRQNPLTAPSLGSNKSFGSSTSISVYAQIDFTDWLMFKSTPSVDIYSSRSKAWLPKFDDIKKTNSVARLDEQFFESRTFNLENQLLFKKSFRKVHNVQATAVYQMRMSEYNGISGTENGFDFEQLNTLSNGGSVSSKIGGSSSQTRLLSYLGRVIYDYSGKYFATASMRSDGSYLFAPGMRRGEFYSGSLAWKVNEDFFKDVKQLDLMKVRIGWGQTGNSNIGGGFQYLDKISDASNFSPVFGDNQLTTRAMYTLYSIASKTIQWETAEMINFGIDINLFNSKLQTSAEYYVKNNTDLLVQVPISMAFGRSTDAGKPWFNSGNIQNKGVELSLQWRDKIKDFNYGITSSFTTINNKVKYLPVPYISGTNNQTIVGNSIGALYGYVADGIVQVSDFTSSVPDAKGIYSGYKYPSQSGFTPQPGDIKYQDLNDDGTVDANDRTIIGKTIPKFTYTLGFDCSYKNFDLNLFLFGVNDFNIYNAQRASLSSMKSNDNDFNKLNDFALNHWTLANASTTHVRVDESNANHNDQISSFWIEDGSFLRIKDFQIGYNATPKMCKNLGVGSFRVYVNASNLYNFTSYKGRDPEGFISSDPTSSGTDNGGYTLPKSYTFGLQVGF